MEFDAIILGSGQAGNPLAERLSQEGWKVAMVESTHLGGTCVNTGCTPTKTLVQRAQIAHYARNSERWGIRTKGVEVDWAKVLEQKNDIVAEWQESVKESLKGVELYWGTASFVSSTSIQVGEQTLNSKKIFINTGASPSIPNIPGLADTPYLTNESILQLESVPESLTVVGGGYIGLEFGQMFSRFGSKVTILQQGGQIVPREDPEVAQTLQSALEKEGIVFRLNAGIEEIHYDQNFKITVSDSVELNSSHLLLATGRRPNTELLKLENAGISPDRSGAIRVNGRLETDVPGIWALGDVKGGPAFTHISYNDFQIVAANLLDGQNQSTLDRIVPYTVFTDPQLGSFGMTEKEARMSGKSLKIGSIPMSKVAKAVERDESEGLMKIVIDAENDQILGATVLSVEGGELIQILYALAATKQPYTVMKRFIFIHPTLAEGLFSLNEAIKPA